MTLENSWAVKTRQSVWWGKKRIFFWAEFTSDYAEPLSALKVLYGMFHKTNILVKEDLIWHCFSSLLQNMDIPPWVGATVHGCVKWMFIKPEFSGTCGFFGFFLLLFIFLELIGSNWFNSACDMWIFRYIKGLYSSRGGFLTEASKFAMQLLWSASVTHWSREVLLEGNLQVPLFLLSVHR